MTQSKLVEIGFSGMTSLFLKISKDGMGRTFEGDTLLQSGERLFRRSGNAVTCRQGRGSSYAI